MASRKKGASGFIKILDIMFSDLRISLVLTLILSTLISPILGAAGPSRHDDSVSLDDDDDAPKIHSADEDVVGPSPSTIRDEIANQDDDDDDRDQLSGFDEDEFVGIPASKEAKETKKDQERDIGSVLPQKANFYPEFAAIALVIAYIFYFIYGRSVNSQIAHAWYEASKKIFEVQFAKMSAYVDQGNDIFIKDSQNCFKFYASGRRNTLGMLATLELKKRQDLFSSLLALVDLSTTQDTLTLEFQMGEELEPFVFAVCRKREEKKLRKNETDLENFASHLSSRRVPKDFVSISDCPELETEILDERIVSTIANNSDLFCNMHITDQNGHVNSPAGWSRVVRFKFLLPPVDQMERLRSLTEMALFCVDRVVSLHLAPATLARARDARAILQKKYLKAAHAQRQEMVQRRKEELKRKEEEAVANMTPEQLRKKEERDHKLSLKKKGPKVKILR
eukprot:TRINITY_DN3407_c0_g1_i1.p1 TRINITY_DN3407_c0_g1~~TRINITY_DN3407_c0_g1_i1.p1  ORF type:complete len:470 (-),score=180.68 TRINITY_DN3407_c0_g1_i1:153-1508(-)